jgi:hypothetical protein
LILALAAAGAARAATEAAAPAIPFPDALDAAAIVEDRLDSIQEHSLILGNGDLNGLQAKVGEGCRLLKQQYALAVAIKTATRQGYRVNQCVGTNGAIVLTLNK